MVVIALHVVGYLARGKKRKGYWLNEEGVRESLRARIAASPAVYCCGWVLLTGMEPNAGW